MPHYDSIRGLLTLEISRSSSESLFLSFPRLRKGKIHCDSTAAAAQMILSRVSSPGSISRTDMNIPISEIKNAVIQKPFHSPCRDISSYV